MDTDIEISKLDHSKLGQRIKYYRMKNHMTQENLSERIGVATSSISHLENGTHTPSLKNLINICNVMHIGVDNLLCDSLSAVSDAFLDRDIDKLLADCSIQEKEIIKDIISVTKQTLRKHR